MIDDKYDSASSGFPYQQPWAKRNGFSDALLAFIWLVTAFFLFQIVAAIAGVILVFALQTDPAGSVDLGNAMSLFSENLDYIFFANSIGQIFFLGLATWFFCRLQVQKANRPHFLRLKYHSSTTALIGVVIGLILVAQPAIWFLGWINSFVPTPQVMDEMQLQQMEMIEGYLRGDGALWIALFNIALVPAICEEILFRGYVMRSFEKSWGITAAIIVSGVLFGMYHLQIANLLPLAAIGILLAVITWATESIIPAMVAHLVNNGGSVLLGKYYPETAFSELSPQSMPPIWLVVVSGIISAYLIYVLIQNKVTAQPNSQRGTL